MFGRGQMVAGAAMLGGSVLGGVIAQATNLGVPFLMRVGVLLAMFVVAARLMQDLGFTPGPLERPAAATRKRLRRLDRVRARRPAGALGDARRAVHRPGVGIYAFYALQPYLLELWGDPKAYSHRRARGRDRRRRADRRRLPRAVDPEAVPEADDAR